MTVLGFLVILLIVSLGKMYLSSDQQEKKLHQENPFIHQEQFYRELSESQKSQKQE